MAELIRKLKYERKAYISSFIGLKMAELLPLLPEKPDLIVPVPLHKRDLLKRSYNQSLLLAKEISLLSNIPLHEGLLVKTKRTRPQVGLTERERRNNIRDAFIVKRPKLLKKKGVLLVDDVMTTGFTAEECASTLLDAGARCVDVIIAARAARA